MDKIVIGDKPIKKYVSNDPIFNTVSRGYGQPVLAIASLYMFDTSSLEKSILINFVSDSKSFDITFYIYPDTKYHMVTKRDCTNGCVSIYYSREGALYFLNLIEEEDNKISF
jgi:hypothetical protein